MKLYINIDSGSDLYLETPDQPELFLKHVPQPELYLALEKANPNRDPSRGSYIHGGKHKAKTEDLSDFLDSLTDEKSELHKD